MEKQQTELNGKIETLSFRVKKTDEILQKDDRVALERQKNLAGKYGDRGEYLKGIHRRKKVRKRRRGGKVQEWAEDVEAAVDEADKCVRQLANKIEQIDRHLRHETALFEHKQAI